MKYDKKLIEKAKGSRCRICQNEITESEAESQGFQATKTSRGGIALCIPVVLRRRYINET
jgi:hypothetical protein